MTLEQELAKLDESIRLSLPERHLSALAAAVEELVACDQAEKFLKAGHQAPDFSLPDAGGATVTLRQLLVKGPAILVFFRGFWCPYCRLDLAAIEAAHETLSALGASVVGISPQTRANSRKTARTLGITFPLLRDDGSRVAERFGVRWCLSHATQAAYRELGVRLEAFNGESSWTLPMPARYVVERDGVIAYAEVNPNYARRPDPKELIPTLMRLRMRRNPGRQSD